jgi:hypothetical protein
VSAGTASSSRLFARFSGENGVEVEVHDESSPYGYGNLIRVRLRVVTRVPGCAQHHERTLERLGTAAEDASRAQQELVARFRETALPYLLRPDFPRRYSEYQQRRPGGSVIRFPASP